MTKMNRNPINRYFHGVLTIWRDLTAKLAPPATITVFIYIFVLGYLLVPPSLGVLLS